MSDTTFTTTFRLLSNWLAGLGSGKGAPVADGPLDPLDYQQMTSLASATALPSVLGATKALIQAEGQSVRYRDDGVNPTATVGMLIADGDSVWYTGDLSAVVLIQTQASAKVNVLYYS